MLFRSQLGIASGDIGKAFSMIKDDPLEFAKRMISLRDSMDPNSTQFKLLSKEIANTNPALKEILQGSKGFSKSLVGLDKALGKSRGEFKKFGDQAFSTNRTTEEAYDFSKQRFITRIRSISDAGKKFTKRSGKYFGFFGKMLLNLAKDKGPLGLFIHKIVDFQQIGMKALIPESWLKGVDGFFDSYTKKVKTKSGKVIKVFDPKKFAKKGGIAGFIKKGLTEALDFFDTFADTLPAKIDHFFASAESGIAKIPWKRINSVMEKVLGAVFSRLGQFVSGGFAAMFGEVAKDDTPITRLGASVGKALGSVFAGVWGSFKNYWKTTWADLWTTFEDPDASMGKQILKSLVGLVLSPGALATMFVGLKVLPIGKLLFDVIGVPIKWALGKALKGGWWASKKVISKSARLVFDKALKPIGKRMGAMFSTSVSAGKNTLGGALGLMRKSLIKFASGARRAASSMGSSILGFVGKTKIGQTVMSKMGTVLSSMSGKMSGVGSLIASMGSKVAGGLGKVSKSILGKAGMVAAAGLAGWAIGKAIGEMTVGGKTINEHTQDLFATMAERWKSFTRTIGEFFGKDYSKEDRNDLLSRSGIGSGADTKTIAHRLEQIVAASERVTSGKAKSKDYTFLKTSFMQQSAIIELLKKSKFDSKKIVDYAAAVSVSRSRLASRTPHFASAVKGSSKGVVGAPGQGGMDAPMIMPATMDLSPHMDALASATNAPEWYSKRFEPLVKEMVAQLRRINGTNGKSTGNRRSNGIGLHTRTALASTGAPG